MKTDVKTKKFHVLLEELNEHNKSKITIIIFLIIALLFNISCSSDDDMITNPPTLTALQLEGTWKVSYFWDQTDRTNEYKDYLFTFTSNGKIEAAINNAAVSGPYKIETVVIDSKQYTAIDILFNDQKDELQELVEDWIVKKVSSDYNMIELEEMESENPPEILHFSRLSN